MSDMDRLQQFFDDCGIAFFDADEVVRARSGFPDEEIWWHMIPTLRLMDRVRAETGVPFHVTSGYRSSEYNESIGGAPNSLHCDFNAVDIWVRNYSAETIAARVRAVLGEDFLARFCGLGVYRDANFIHFDTRGLTVGMRGATWHG